MRRDNGIIIGFAGLSFMAIGFFTLLTGTLDDFVSWVLGAELLNDLMKWLVIITLVAVVAGAGMATRHTRSSVAHVHGGRRRTVIKHEAAHAAVAHGVGAGNIRATLKPGGGGQVTCDVHRMSPAEYIAYCRAGRAVAGRSGDCQHDIAQEKQELNCLPVDQRAKVSREADRIVSRHVHSEFGRRVARALETDGKF